MPLACCDLHQSRDCHCSQQLAQHFPGSGCFAVYLNKSCNTLNPPQNLDSGSTCRQCSTAPSLQEEHRKLPAPGWPRCFSPHARANSPSSLIRNNTCSHFPNTLCQKTKIV